ncbi:hypothetical protein [Aeromonas simiae]|uniref:Flagellar M-ring protein FliF n=1 Tax=Aeromonas simiae TaxID=218936 RepID=A0A5J6WXZ8_9GAMM|nr:hypothetical protein [Aeromonas simiae]QFI55892.1 hypothetical protein FE240_15075 [Aeromonas simiae]
MLGLVLVIFGIRPLVKHLIRPPQPEGAEAKEQNQELALSGELESAVGIEGQLGEGEQVESASSRGLIRGEEKVALDDLMDLDALPEPGSELEVQLRHLQLLVEKDTDRVAEVIKQWVGGNE